MESILVVKLSGSAGMDLQAACADLAEIARQRPLVVLHGASERTGQLCSERGIPVEMLTSPGGHSSRYTPPAVRDVFVEAAHSINRDIVQALSEQGCPAHGLTAEVAIHGERKTALRAVVNGKVRVVRDDHSGSISHVDAQAIHALLASGTVVVMPPLANSADGLLNIDGDRAAAAVAAAVGAQELVILSNVRGLYRRFPDPDSFVAHVPRNQIEQAMEWAQGRMKRKVLSAQEAIAGGLQRVVIAHGGIQHPVSLALAGEGTVFSA
jgi:acetylglutamate/LysW-gamma-L-alpha-aminoadipate kinase